MIAIKQFIYDWGWVIINSLVWGYAGHMFMRRRVQSRRWLQRLSPHERRMYDGMRIMEKKVRRQAFKHPFWGKEKREAFVRQAVAETVLMQFGYQPGDPCPLPVCDRGFVDSFDPEHMQFPERVPCPACRLIKEVHGVAPTK